MLWLILLFQPIAASFALFFVKSVVGPHDIWKQWQNLITFWCRITKKIHGECHIFNQSEQSCLEMLTFLTNENQILPPWLLCGFLRPPGDFFTFNQPNIKYLYVIWCFLHIGPCRFHNILPCSVGTRPRICNCSFILKYNSNNRNSKSQWDFLLWNPC